MSMVRRAMKAARMAEKRTQMNGKCRIGKVRTGMHQRSEYEFREALAVLKASDNEYVENVAEIPEELEEMIPEESSENPEAENVAEGEVVIVVESENSEDAEQSEAAEETVLSVDYSGEQMPLLDPVTGGTDCSPRELVYDSGDGSVRAIPDPLGVLHEVKIPFFIPEIEDPSANVPAAG